MRPLGSPNEGGEIPDRRLNQHLDGTSVIPARGRIGPDDKPFDLAQRWDSRRQATYEEPVTFLDEQSRARERPDRVDVVRTNEHPRHTCRLAIRHDEKA